jgi:hypothetical protein
MIDIVIQAFAISLPALVAIDKGRMGFAFIFFLIAITPTYLGSIFFGAGEYPLVFIILKWFFWFLSFVLSIKIKNAKHGFNEAPLRQGHHPSWGDEHPVSGATQAGCASPAPLPSSRPHKIL